MSDSKQWLLSKCKHFNGIMNEVCKIGVRYNSVCVKNPGEGLSFLYPCIADNRCAELCPKFEAYTDEAEGAQELCRNPRHKEMEAELDGYQE